MKLNSLKLTNFRQFYGEQELQFSEEGEENVTVIHGSNGAGKTALLNSFLWLFYNKTKLPKPKRLANEKAMAEADVGDAVKVQVELEFDHEGKHYWATRTAEYKKEDKKDMNGSLVYGENELSVALHDRSGKGNVEEKKNASNVLSQILPKRLSDLFFFHGEKIAKLSEERNRDEVKTAIQNIMGLTILERAIRHFDNIEDRFEEVMERHASHELEEHLRRKKEIEKELEEKKEELEEKKKYKHQKQVKINKVENRLGELEDTRKLQEEREELEQDEKKLKSDISDINEEMKKLISKKAYLVFALPSVQETAKELKKKRVKGEIPSSIKKPFVNDRLEMGKCICGRELKKGTKAFERVKKWKKKAGSDEFDEKVINLTSRLGELVKERKTFFKELESKIETRGKKKKVLEKIRERLDQITTDIQEKESENAQKLEKKRNKLREEQLGLEREIGGIEGEIRDLEKKIKTVEKKIVTAKKENKKAEIARRRWKATKLAKDKVKETFEDFQNTVRKKVNGIVNDTFTSIILKNYYAMIEDDYSLSIMKDIGGTQKKVAMSRGERQVASLSFIASLVSLARKRYQQEEESIFFKGGIYPVIMDAPFGTLDPDYRRKVSKTMHQMAEQVVVLVTESQWKGEVQDELEEKSGKQYYLEYYDPEERPDIKDEYTEIKTRRS